MYIKDIASNYLTPRAIMELSVVAYHKVAPLLCSGSEIHPEGVRDSPAGVHPTNIHQRDDVERVYWQDATPVNIGMIFGVMLAEHTGEEDVFRTEVESVISDPGSAWHLFDTEAMTSADDEAGSGAPTV